MNRFIRIATVSMLLLLLASFVVPSFAQEPAGGVIIEGNAGADPSTLDPILCTDTTCTDIDEFIFPDAFAVDPATATISTTGGPGAIVNGVDISDDGMTYTLHLREDMAWTDGTPITADDMMYVWDAINNGADTPLTFVLDTIESYTKVDDHTIEVKMYEANCDALVNIAAIEPYPSHIAPEDVTTLADQPFALNPTVTYNVFNFSEFRPSESISLTANQGWKDAEMGYVNPEGYITITVPDLTVNVERFLAGELNVIDGPQESRRAEIYAAADAGDVKVYTYPGGSWDYLAFNLADPTIPQDALDADGNAIDQGMHPIFGNTTVGRDVRYALNLALNVDEIIEGSTFGEGTRMASSFVPASWAYDDNLAPVAYDPVMAAQILTDAGWVNSNPDDPTSIRVCQGCGTTEDGTEMSFDLITNEENGRRTSIITIAQDQWSQIGVQANIQTIEFFTMLDIINAQEWDSFVLGWRNGYPDQPDQTQLFGAVGDVVGSGSNSGSYLNSAVDDLMVQARSVPGCDTDTRKDLYAQIQEQIQHDTPYIFLFVRNGFYAVSSDVEGFDPAPENLWWNVDTWSVAAKE
jgi:peptide/nickel transport system substrate-binding protein